MYSIIVLDSSGLGEMMNFPGVIHRDKEVMDKLAVAKKYNKPSNIREELNASYININKTDISLKLSTRNMLENYYKSDIHKLEILTGLDCSH